MILFKSGPMLYEGVCQLIADNLDRLAKEDIIPTLPNGGSNDPLEQGQEAELLLRALRRVWDDHTGGLLKMQEIVKYMDRAYATPNDLPCIRDAGLDLFLKQIICPPTQDHIVSAVLTLIGMERDGYTINRAAVKGCVDMLRLAVDRDGKTVYERDIVPRFLVASEAFYKDEAECFAATCDAPEYLLRAEARLDSEKLRIDDYLPSQTGAAAALCKMLENGDCVGDVGVGGGGTDRGVGGDGEMGAQGGATQTLTLALKWVRDVLDLKDKFNRLWKQAFESDQAVEGWLNEAFNDFINLNKKASEFISLFIHETLKQDLKYVVGHRVRGSRRITAPRSLRKTDAEVDLILDKTITILKFVTEKDTFERHYKDHLVERLRSGQSLSEDAERRMLAKLQIDLECGSKFTSELEDIISGMKMSSVCGYIFLDMSEAALYLPCTESTS
ncbi:Cullin repeat-like-containing domain protein [Melanogaster broomeanus]|nr:Cullin repeat-like-containing domain protein [Melanogaster broomeanus]